MNIKINWFTYISLFFLSIPLALHAYLGSFSRLLGDDYCSAAIANRIGIIKATWYWYITWSGRYSANALDSIFGVLGPKITPFVTLFVTMIWLVSIAIAFYIIIPLRRNKALGVTLLAAGTLFLTLNFTPNIQQSLYWGQGMRSVVPPLILGTIYLGIFFVLKKTERLNRKVRTLWSILSFLLAFGIGGFSETYSVVQLVAIGYSTVTLFVVYRYKFKSVEFNFLFIGLLGAALSMITTIVAPGNAFRTVYFPPRPDIFGILEISSKGILVYFDGMFSTIESIAGFFGIFLLSFLIGYKDKNKNLSLRNLSIILAGGLLLIFSCFPPAAYGMSDMPPGRTLIIATYFFSIMVLLGGYYFGNMLAVKKNDVLRHINLIAKTGVLVSLFYSSFIVCNNMYADREKYIEFATEWDKTHEILISLKNSGEDVIVPAVVDEWSGVLRMTDNQRFYVNVCASDYYGVERIIATDDSITSPP